MAKSLKHALQNAGLDAAIRLERIEDGIIRETIAIDDALQEYYSAISGDAAILWMLFEDFRRSVCLARLRAAYARKREASGGAKKIVDTNAQMPRPTAALQPAARTAAAATLRTIFDTMNTPLGKSLGDLTREECVALYGRSKREARVYAYCASRMPDGVTVREFLKPEEIEAIVRASKMENEHE